MSRIWGTARPRRVLLATPGGTGARTATIAVRLAAAGLLAGIGVVHLLLAPVYYEAAAYVGVGFYVTFGLAVVSAAGIIVGVRGAWLSAGLVAAGALAGLAAATTVGLPGFTDSLSAPWAMLSLGLEGGFVALYLALVALRRNPLLAPR